MRLLFSGADILRPDFTVLKNAFLGVDGAVIDYIGAERPTASYDEEKDMRGKLLMPGLYNMHTHTSMVLLRGLGSDLPLDRWLHEAMFPIEARLTPEDISVGTRLAMMEMLSTGTVSFTDMYDMPRVTVDEVSRAGMKANLNRPVLSFDPDERYEDNHRVTESLAFFADCNGAAQGRIIADFAIHAEYTSHDEMVRRYGADCLARGANMHLHLSETAKEHEECKQRHGKTPARWFADLGVFDSPTYAAHCVMVEDEDLAILRDKGVTCVHNPSSNLKLGSGFMPLTRLLEHDIRVCIGTDGAASNNNLNLFEEMHLAAIIHKGKLCDPTVVRPEQVLQMATRNGALAQGRADCGALAVGHRADVVAIDLNRPHLMPNHDTAALLVYAVQGSDVCMTMVDGRILYENGAFLTIDTERVMHDLRASCARLFGEQE